MLISILQVIERLGRDHVDYSRLLNQGRTGIENLREIRNRPWVLVTLGRQIIVAV